MKTSKIIFSIILIVGVLFSGCTDYSRQESNTAVNELKGSDYIISLVDCEDAYISRNYAGYDGHKGVDVVAPEGVKIYAADDGVIYKKVYMNLGYGNYIIVDHEGYQTLYAHCSEFTDKDVGKPVKKGDIIAYVGNTGNSTGAHLHFEVIVDNEKVDPSQWYE